MSEVPETIIVRKLFPYQQQTVEFIEARYQEFKVFARTSFEPSNFLSYDLVSGVLIGHDPGLGKTVITCEFLEEEFCMKTLKFVLIISPKTVEVEWKQHFLDWCPNVCYLEIEGDAKHKNKLFDKIESYTELIVLISWPNVLKYITRLKEINFDIIIADESTEIKNVNSAIFKAMKQFNMSTFKIALSGTPIMNNLTELFAVIDFICPGYFGLYKTFRKYFIDQLAEAKQDNNAELQYALENELKEQLERIMLRFTKATIIDELSAKEEILVWNDLTKAQLEEQDNILNERKLRNISAFEALSELKVTAEYYEHVSSKIDVIIVMVEFFKRKNLKVLLFAEFIETLKLIIGRLKGININSLIITGETDIKERAAITAQFQESKEFQILLLTTKVGSFGLNLQEAERVILTSPAWNPQLEFQAISRAWRLGNEKQVKIYKLVCRESIDSKIVERQMYKREILSVIGGDEKFDISEDLFDVFSLNDDCEVKYDGGDSGLLLDLQQHHSNVAFGQIACKNEIFEVESNVSSFIVIEKTIGELRQEYINEDKEEAESSEIARGIANIFGTTREDEEETDYFPLEEKVDSPSTGDASGSNDEIGLLFKDYKEKKFKEESIYGTENPAYAKEDEV